MRAGDLTCICEVANVEDDGRIGAILGGLQDVVQGGAGVVGEAPIRDQKQSLWVLGTCNP